MFMHLLLNCDLLADEVAAVPGEQLETDEERIGLGLEQTEAVDCGAVDGGEIGVIGLVAGVGGLSELFGRERVDDADLGAGLGEGALDRSVVAAGALDGDDVVLDAVPVQGLAEEPHGGPKTGLIMLDDGGWDEDSAVEVGEHDFGPSLGAIDAEDAEVLGSDGLDPGMKDSVGLVNGVRAGTAARFRPSGTSHGTGPPERVGKDANSYHWKSGWL